MKRPLIVGQAPSSCTDPDVPLSGRSGLRLADLCGVTPEEFLLRFERVNLLDAWPGKAGKGDNFPMDLARNKVIAMMISGAMVGRRTVLLGGNVSGAFGLRKMKPLAWTMHGETGLAMCPHPSGANLWWNDPANVEAARKFWRDLVQST